MRDLSRITDEIAAHVEARAGEVLERFTPEGRRRRQRARERRRKAAVRIAKRLVAAWLAVLVAAVAWALVIGPLGMMGAMLMVAALLLASFLVLTFSRSPEPRPEAIAASDLPLLPQRIEEWLETQRPALPAPAARLVDGIGLKLEALAPQLATLDPREPAAAEVRKLLCDDLTELVKGYRRVPEGLRRQDRDGPSPDRQLVEGLRLVDEELERMSGTLASGDLHRLSVQGRYLELKYRGDGEIES